MDFLQAVILGLIQGFTEFLPISSSGHVEIGTVLLHVKTSENLLFLTVIHAATCLSTIVVYRKDIGGILKGLREPKLNESWHFTLKILLSAIPVVIVGLLFMDDIDMLFGGRIVLISCMLIITSFLLGFTYFVKANEGEVTYPKAFIIGIAQTIAVLPGLSRSGSTIATGLLMGVDRTRITRFSFLMVIIPVLGASFLDLVKIIKQPSMVGDIPATMLLTGFIAAFISGFIACKWMINIVKNGKLIYFAVYCFIVGTATLLITLL